MRRAQTLAEQTADKGELAVLVDGPWRGAWYWRADLEARQASARRMHARGATARLDDQCDYRPTEQWITHPTEPDVSGRAWTYHPPPVCTAPEPPAETAPAETAAAVTPPCAVCGQPLLLRRPGRSVCERCRLDQRPKPPETAVGAAVTATPAAPTATTSRSTAMDEGVSTR